MIVSASVVFCSFQDVSHVQFLSGDVSSWTMFANIIVIVPAYSPYFGVWGLFEKINLLSWQDVPFLSGAHSKLTSVQIIVCILSHSILPSFLVKLNSPFSSMVGIWAYCVGLLFKRSEDASGITGEMTLYPLLILWVELLKDRTFFSSGRDICPSIQKSHTPGSLIHHWLLENMVPVSTADSWF